VVIVPAAPAAPAPFKIFVLLAGVAAIPVWPFAAAIFIAAFHPLRRRGTSWAVYYGDQPGLPSGHAKEAGYGWPGSPWSWRAWIAWQKRRRCIINRLPLDGPEIRSHPDAERVPNVGSLP